MTNETLERDPRDQDSAADLRVLVVDDDPMHRHVIGRVAQASGYAPAEAYTYGEIAALLQTQAYDCISLDLSLGAFSGIEVLQLVAKLGLKTPLIIVSGSDEAVLAEAMEIARRHALNIYPPLRKPLNVPDLRLAFTTIRMRSTVGLQGARRT